MLSTLLHKSLQSLAGDYNNWLKLPSIQFTTNHKKTIDIDSEDKNTIDTIQNISKGIIVYQNAGKNILQHIKILVELQKLLVKEKDENQDSAFEIPLSHHPAINIARQACRQKFIDKK